MTTNTTTRNTTKAEREFAYVRSGFRFHQHPTSQAATRQASNKAARRADRQNLASEPTTWAEDLEEGYFDLSDNEWTDEELETLIFNQDYWDGQFFKEYDSPLA